MKFGADNLPNDPVLLKALVLQLQEQVALLRHKLFSPKSERSPEDADSPQLAMFNEVEELIEAPAAEPAEAEAEAEAEEFLYTLRFDVNADDDALQDDTPDEGMSDP